MSSHSRHTAALIGLAATVLASTGQAATHAVSQDTYIYEFFGNQGIGTGESNGLMVWNHETNHGAKALLQFDSAWSSDALLSGNYVATLNLYSQCTAGGFVSACAGDEGTVTTDVVLQSIGWTEGDAGLGWSNISEASAPSASFTQTSSAHGWLSVDITNLTEAWLNGGVSDFGLALTQEAYGVSRTSSGSLMASSFCDSESACAANFAPFLEITEVPVPAAAWLFGSALLGLAGLRRKRS